MMTYLKDACLCIVLSMSFTYISVELNSSFFQTAIGSILEAICGIFAINIASTALIAELLTKISEKTGKTFDKPKATLMMELKIQGSLIVLVVIFMIVYYADLNINSVIYSYKDKISYWSQVGILSIFIYFIWLTHDLGKALFEVLKAKLN